jgi:hypothetical protein
MQLAKHYILRQVDSLSQSAYLFEKPLLPDLVPGLSPWLVGCDEAAGLEPVVCWGFMIQCPLASCLYSRWHAALSLKYTSPMIHPSDQVSRHRPTDGGLHSPCVNLIITTSDQMTKAASDRCVSRCARRSWGYPNGHISSWGLVACDI